MRMNQKCETCVYQTLPSVQKEFKENEYIFFDGDNLDSVYIVDEGLVKVTKIYMNGEEKTFEILGPCEFVALVAVLRKKDTYVANAQAITKVKARQISKTAILTAYEENNSFKEMCIDCLMNRTNQFQEQLFHSQNLDTEEKIINMLKFLSQKFGGSTDQTVVKLPFSKTVLANLIGLRRETLSRKLSAMQKDGLIEVNRNSYKIIDY